jgi:hypothetical protein
MKQTKVERFIVEPNITPIFGVTVKKDTDIEDWTEDKKIHQTIKDLVITTEETDERKNGDIEISIKSVMKIKVPEGTRLIWTEGSGYILPTTQRLMTRKEIKEDLDNLDGIEGLE